MSGANVFYCLGSCNLDLQVRAERWPEPGETLLTSDLLRTGGGKAANRAFLARRLGLPAVLLACIGEDDFGEQALESVRRAGVDLSQVKSSVEHSTGLAMIVVRADGDKTILLAPGANDDFSTADAQRIAEMLKRASPGSVLSIDLEVPSLVVRAATASAKERGLTVVIDPSPADRMNADLYPAATCITPNHGEAARLCGFEVRNEEQALRAGEEFVRRGATSSCVKLPGGGCVVVTKEQHSTLKAPAARVVDKTGAGDAFAGALSAALFEGQNIFAAARAGVFASALAVTKFGSQASYPDRQTLERALLSNAVDV
ncbi:MAG: ribokinase [Myxococcota bacterium]